MNIAGGKGGWCVRLTSPPSHTECHKIWESKPPGTLWAGHTGPALPFTQYSISAKNTFVKIKQAQIRV
jgi:hypothetical protein